MVTIYLKDREIDKFRTIRSLSKYVLRSWLHLRHANKILVASSDTM